MVDRIRKIMERESLNSALFADKIGVSRGTITHVLSGRNKPSLEVVQKILDTFPNINSEWLLVGKNAMHNHDKVILRPHQEPTLFDDDSKALNPPKNEINATKEPEAPEYPLKSIDKTPSEVRQIIEKEVVREVISSSKKIDKIMIFYSDNTFEGFSPDK